MREKFFDTVRSFFNGTIEIVRPVEEERETIRHETKL